MNYALLAENKYLVEKQLNKIINDLKVNQEIEIFDYNGLDKDFNVEVMLNELNTFPFLSDHKVIVLSNPNFLSAKGTLSESSINNLEAYMKSPASFSTLIIYVDQFKVDNRKKITKVVKKHAKVFEPEVLDERAVSSIIRNDLAKNKINIQNNALQELVKRVFPNFDNWPQELEKLTLYNKKNLELQDIEVLINMSDEDNVFLLVNGVLDKNLHLSLNTYRNLPQKEREPIAMIMLLASQFRLIHQVQTLLNGNIPPKEIAISLKVHPYRVTVAQKSARKYSSQQILKVLSDLSDLEQNIKNGNVNPDIGFELFLVEASQ